MTQAYSTLRVAPGDDGVLGVVIDAPPMNLIGPELVRDLVSLLGELESGQETRVVVLESADPEYFVPHVDLTKVAEYTTEAAKAGGPDDASLGMLWHKLSELPVVTIAKVRGRARGGSAQLGSERLSDPHVLQQTRQGWALRRLGGARAVHQRGPRGVPASTFQLIRRSVIGHGRQSGASA